jgi:hypothetical protein
MDMRGFGYRAGKGRHGAGRRARGQPKRRMTGLHGKTGAVAPVQVMMGAGYAPSATTM